MVHSGSRITQLPTEALFSPISVNASGDTTVVIGVAGKQIRVVRYEFTVAGDVTVTWKSQTAGAITGPMPFIALGGISSDYTPSGIFQTAVGEGLVINLSDAISVGGELVYILV